MNRREFLMLAAVLISGFAGPGRAEETNEEDGQECIPDDPEVRPPAQEPPIPAEPPIRALIDLETQTFTLYEEQAGRITATRFPCVVGRRNRRGGSATRPGLYEVTYKSASDHALHGRFGAVYGRRYIGLRNLRTGAQNIGIHGTFDEEKLDRENRYFSLGCVRLGNETIEDTVYPTLQRGNRIGIVERAAPELERALEQAIRLSPRDY